MADVYLAEQTSLRRQVAFKVLKQELASTDNYVQRFRNEAQAAASLVHANIVQIHEVGCIDGNHFIAQEYVPGSNLRQHMQRNGRVDLAMGVSIMGQVAAALQRAGEQGIVHRDIKPDNIMLATNGEVKVADFGLARIIQDSSDVELTQVGMTLGTPLYMSPEQAEAKTADHRSDIYSFGVTCYHMLGGRPPFEGDTALSVAVQHVKNEADDLKGLRPDLPPRLCRTIHRMIAKKPDDRYQRAGELIRDLTAIEVPGLEQAEWVHTITSEAGDTIADARLGIDATQRLQTVMETEAAAPKGKHLIGVAIAGIIGSLLLGALAAWVMRPADLLKSSGPAKSKNEPSKSKKLATVQEQYLAAALSGDETVLLSVSRYFPPNKSRLNQYYARRADQRLAELYLDRNDVKQAEGIYAGLAKLAEAEPQFRAIGYAGLANIHHRQNQHSLLVDDLKQLLRISRTLPPPTRRPIFESLDRAVYSELAKMPQARQLLPSRAPRNRPRTPRGTGRRRG